MRRGSDAHSGSGAASSRSWNWGRWGDDDRRGAANLIGPRQVRDAARLVRQGKVFSLALPIDASAPRFPARQAHRHLFTVTGADAVAGGRDGAGVIAWNDDAIEMALQGSTHWDGLGHMQVGGRLYSDFWAGDVTASGGDAVLGIGHQRESFVGRGVLLDVARHLGVESLEPGQVIGPDLLQDVLARERVGIARGDIVLVRTGYLGHWWSLVTDADRSAYWEGFPGLGRAAGEWLGSHDVAAAASDTVGFEVQPFEDEADPFPVHRRLLFELGITIGELWALDRLAADCADDGVFEFLLVAPPLHIPTAVGSPLNPVALK